MPKLQDRFSLLFATGWMAVVVLSVALASPAHADEADQVRAREAVRSGEVAPLSKLLAVVEAAYEGEMLKVELEDEDVKKWGGTGDGKMFIYEIKILTPQGNLVKLKYDAKSLELLKVEGYGNEDD